MLLVNQVFQQEDKWYRLLWSDTANAFWIDIYEKTAWPEIIQVHQLDEMIKNGALKLVVDPFLDVILREVKVDSIEWNKRESGWNILVGELDNLDIYSSSGRASAIKRMMKIHHITHQTAYRLLRRYWQRGMSRNALLPDYVNSGAKGKIRSPKERKLGRPRTVKDGEGCNITNEIERIFRQVIESKLLIEKRPVISDAHVIAIGSLKNIYPHATSYNFPTIEQFRYFFKREYRVIDIIEKQTNAIDYAKDIRPIMGTSTTDSLGPGYRYQIDATIADIYLISESDRSRIVGRPVVYIVIDVFSRMVTGIYVGFEGPSWVSAMMALANTVSDKVEYCRQFDIEISYDEWPVQGLPSVILADKGELNGTKIEVFAEATGMRIENAPARRGDAKGIVERYFRTLQDGFKPYLSGIVEPHMSRKMGGHDYRQDATLTLSEFTKIIIAGVLWHNNFHTLSKYDRSELMPGDIPAVPLMLWNWGLANMTGKLRSISEDVARINLMPHDQATVSDLGICIFGCYYTCTEALKQGWFHRGDGKRPSTLQVAYDPRSADHIYVRPVNDLKTYWICDLADRSRRFRGMTFWDVWLLIKLERKSDANATMNAIVAKGTLLQQINDIAANAQSLKPTNSGLVKKDLGLQIRSNKQAEKNIERQKTAFRPEEQLNDNPADVVHIHGNSEQDYSYPDMTDLLFGDEENE